MRVSLKWRHFTFAQLLVLSEPAFPAAWQNWWAQCCSASERCLLIWVGMLKTLGMHGDSTLLYIYPMLGIYVDIIFQNFYLDLKSRRWKRFIVVMPMHHVSHILPQIFVYLSRFAPYKSKDKRNKLEEKWRSKKMKWLCQGQTAGWWRRQEYKHELYCHSARKKGWNAAHFFAVV